MTRTSNLCMMSGEEMMVLAVARFTAFRTRTGKPAAVTERAYEDSESGYTTLETDVYTAFAEGIDICVYTHYEATSFNFVNVLLAD